MAKSKDEQRMISHTRGVSEDADRTLSDTERRELRELLIDREVRKARRKDVMYVLTVAGILATIVGVVINSIILWLRV